MIRHQRQAIAAGVTLAALIASVSLGVWFGCLDAHLARFKTGA